MPVDRFFTPVPLETGEKISFEGTEMHHMVRVLRVQPKEEIEIVNGKGVWAKGQVEEIGKKSVTVRIVAMEKKSLSLPLLLGLALVQSSRLDFVLEKGTELGVTEFWLFPGEYSKKKELSSSQRTRCEYLLISAMKQCGRFDLPLLRYCSPLKEWKEMPPLAFFGDLSEKAPLFSQVWRELSPLQEEKPLFLIGPERGFSPAEETLLRSWGAHGVQLHAGTLRSETAALVAASLLSHWRLTPAYHSPGER